MNSFLGCPSSERCFLFTFDFEVVSSKAVGLEVEGQRCVGLVQEQVDPGQLDAVPLEHRVENLAGDTQTKKNHQPLIAGRESPAAAPALQLLLRLTLTPRFSFSSQGRSPC